MPPLPSMEELHPPDVQLRGPISDDERFRAINMLVERHARKNDDGTPRIDDQGRIVLRSDKAAIAYLKLKNGSPLDIYEMELVDPKYKHVSSSQRKKDEAKAVGGVVWDALNVAGAPEKAALLGLGGLIAGYNAAKAGIKGLGILEKVKDANYARKMQKAPLRNPFPSMNRDLGEIGEISIAKVAEPRPALAGLLPGPGVANPMTSAEIAAARANIASGPARYRDFDILESLRSKPLSPLQTPIQPGQVPVSGLLPHSGQVIDMAPESARQIMSQRLWMEGIPSQGIPPKTLKMTPDGHIVIEKALSEPLTNAPAKTLNKDEIAAFVRAFNARTGKGPDYWSMAR